MGNYEPTHFAMDLLILNAVNRHRGEAPWGYHKHSQHGEYHYHVGYKKRHFHPEDDLYCLTRDRHHVERDGLDARNWRGKKVVRELHLVEYW